VRRRFWDGQVQDGVPASLAPSAAGAAMPQLVLESPEFSPSRISAGCKSRQGVLVVREKGQA
jgi:hypothetical protein